MKYYLDTNIWIAALLDKHPKHQNSKQLIIDCLEQNIEIVTSGHCLAEVYSVLTKLPLAIRIQPDVVITLIDKNMVANCEIIDLNTAEYIEVLKEAANNNLTSGTIFDGLHVKAALKARVNKIFTYNLKDFKKFEIPETIELLKPAKHN